MARPFEWRSIGGPGPRSDGRANRFFCAGMAPKRKCTSGGSSPMRSAPLRPSGGSTLSRWSWSPKSSSVRNSRSHCGAHLPTAARRTSSTPEFTHPCLLRGHESATSNAGAMRDGGERARVAQEGVGIEPERGGVRRLHHRDRLRHVPKKRWQCRLKRRSYSAHFARYAVASASMERQDEVDEAPRRVRLVGDDAQFRRRRRRAHLRRCPLEQPLSAVPLVLRPEKATKQTPNARPRAPARAAG